MHTVNFVSKYQWHFLHKSYRFFLSSHSDAEPALHAVPSSNANSSDAVVCL